ncbi:hypothetical protein XFF6970_1010036 [Xanthomonas citri pv. fuscans]|nr:hypothetical protein XFF6970_1010036 [Xanthomonas citri pv. fuscans]
MKWPTLKKLLRALDGSLSGVGSRTPEVTSVQRVPCCFGSLRQYRRSGHLLDDLLKT